MEIKNILEEVKDKESIGVLIDDLYNQIKTMKNIYLIPTDKPSRLIIYSTLLNEFRLLSVPIEDWKHKKHMYITSSDEEIKLNDYITDGYRVYKWKDDSSLLGRKKIVITTDHDLIKDGVQAIDDDFLNWFVKNPSRESVEVEDVCGYYKANELSEIEKNRHRFIKEYQIIIPQEESKQENNKFLEKDTIIAWNESINFLENYKTDEIVGVVDNTGKIDLEASKILKRISDLNREKELLFHKLLEICKEEK